MAFRPYVPIAQPARAISISGLDGEPLAVGKEEPSRDSVERFPLIPPDRPLNLASAYTAIVIELLQPQNLSDRWHNIVGSDCGRLCLRHALEARAYRIEAPRRQRLQCARLVNAITRGG